MQQDDRIESLHEKAAAQYLQGDFVLAKSLWRELLELDPADERAIEGVRLCEMLQQQSASPDASASSSDTSDAPGTHDARGAHDAAADAYSAPAPATAAQETPEGGADDMQWDLSALNLEGSPDDNAEPTFGEPEAQTSLGDPGEAIEPAQPGELGLQTQSLDEANPVSAYDPQALELGDLPAIDIDLPPREEPEPYAEENAVPEAPSATGLEAFDEDPATLELRNRVNDLLREATQAYEAGDAATAQRVLERLFILDDQNAEGLNLQNVINAEMDGGGDAPVLEVADDAPELALQTPEPAVETEDDDANAFDFEPPTSEDDAEFIFDEPLQADGPDEAEAQAVSQPSGKRRLPSLGQMPRRAVLGGAVLLVAVLGVSFMLFGRGGNDGPSDRAAAGLVGGGSNANDADSSETISIASDPEQVEAEPVVEASTLLAEAQEHFDAGRYEQAIIGLDAVLKLEPDQPLARQLMRRAGVLYRKKTSEADKVERGRELFHEGEYAAALKVFYRLPEGQVDGKVDRYKANGWYNLALRALRVGNCADARSHLAEAKALRPEMSGLSRLREKTLACPTARYSPAFLDEAALLVERGLED